MQRVRRLFSLCILLLMTGCSDTTGDDDATAGSPSDSPDPDGTRPEIEIDSTTVDFGQLDVGAATTVSRTLANRGTADLNLTYQLTHDGSHPETFLFSGPASAVPPAVLPPGTTADLMIRFAPTDGIGYTGSLIIRSNDGDQPEVVLPLTGTGHVTVTDDDTDGHLPPDDCDNQDPSVYPGAEELCDEKDNDCDGQVDEDAIPAFVDADGDGHGDPDLPTAVCELTDGWSTDDLDCDDAHPGTHPDADEVCDSHDNDCDGAIDEDQTTIFYLDVDADEHGDPVVATQVCTAPEGYVEAGDDCNDRDDRAHPGATEQCNRIDDDCDGEIDEETLKTWFFDADRDSWGDPDSELEACSSPGSKYVDRGGDCDDLKADVNPDGTEGCNTLDDDCDGEIDESDPTLDFDSDDAHCGGCFQACDLANADSSCSAGICEVTTCRAGYYDLDDKPANGCELLSVKSCDHLQTIEPASASGTYPIDPDGPGTGAAPFQVACDMTTEGGGWTLISSVVNDATHRWSTLSVFTGTSIFGSAATYQTIDYKSAAHKTVPARDLMIRTEAYAFGFEEVLDGKSFGDFIAARWPSSCNRSWYASGADFLENLPADQAGMFGLSLRAADDKGVCFPGTTTNAAVSFTGWESSLTNGIGSCTACGEGPHDESMLQRAQLASTECTAGTWPCNDQGYFNGEVDCEDGACTVSRVEVWVR